MKSIGMPIWSTGTKLKSKAHLNRMEVHLKNFKSFAMGVKFICLVLQSDSTWAQRTYIKISDTV